MSEIDFEAMDEKEIIEISIKSEIESQEIYEAILEQDVSENLRKRIKNFLESEKRHEENLRNIFNDWYLDENPRMTDKSVNIEGQIIEATDNVEDLLRKALEDKKNTGEIYSNLGDKAEDKSQARTFKHLAYIERKHYEALKEELEEFEKREPPDEG